MSSDTKPDTGNPKLALVTARTKISVQKGLFEADVAESISGCNSEMRSSEPANQFGIRSLRVIPVRVVLA